MSLRGYDSWKTTPPDDLRDGLPCPHGEEDADRCDACIDSTGPEYDIGGDEGDPDYSWEQPALSELMDDEIDSV